MRGHAMQRELRVDCAILRLATELAILLANPAVPDLLGVRVDDEARST